MNAKQNEKQKKINLNQFTHANRRFAIALNQNLSEKTIKMNKILLFHLIVDFFAIVVHVLPKQTKGTKWFPNYTFLNSDKTKLYFCNSV